MKTVFEKHISGIEIHTCNKSDSLSYRALLNTAYGEIQKEKQIYISIFIEIKSCLLHNIPLI